MKLAALGYTALAVDMYGSGKLAAHPDDAGKFMNEVFARMDKGQARFEAAKSSRDAGVLAKPIKRAKRAVDFPAESLSAAEALVTELVEEAKEKARQEAEDARLEKERIEREEAGKARAYGHAKARRRALRIRLAATATWRWLRPRRLRPLGDCARAAAVAARRLRPLGIGSAARGGRFAAVDAA